MKLTSSLSLPRLLLKTLLLFAAFNLLFAVTNPLPALGHLTAYNHFFPGRPRLPFGDQPELAYNLSLYNLEAMFAAHEIANGPKPTDEYRILLLGDSSVWGFLLTPEQTLTGILNQAGLVTASGQHIRAYNLGYPTLTLTKDLLLLERALAYDPDLIIWITTLSANLIPVFLDGQAKDKNPYAFTTLGDCQSEPPVFMGIYGTDRYFLGTGYEYLQETIDFFTQSNSFERQSYCTQNGLSVASALSPAWADPDDCETGEPPLACEIRLHQPSLMFINLGTNWSVNATASHEAYLRQIVDILLAEGVIPVLSTKGDNVEGDWSLNQSIAQVAYDYDLPLWNFWAAIQHLPKHGLDPERPGGNYLIIEAWDRRSFTGLQVLDTIRQTLEPYYP